MRPAGRRRDRIRILTPVRTKDARGQDVLEWREFDPRPAEVVELAGRDRERAMQAGSTTQVRIWLDHDPAITPQHRVRWGARTLEIIAATDSDGRRREMVIEAREHKP